LITLVGGAAVMWPLAARAQQPKRLPVVALVFPSLPLAESTGPDPVSPLPRAFVHGLREDGWIEGSTVVIERRSAEGEPQRVPAIFAELLARGVDVIVLAGARWLHDAAQLATRTIPTVALFTDDPVAAGLIKSLTRPGGNLTGVTAATGPEFYGKRLQLLQEIAPRTARAAFLGPRGVLEQYFSVARPTGVTVIPVQVEVAAQYEEAFATILRERADALLVSGGAVNFLAAERIAAFAAKSRLPAIYSDRVAIAAGGLMSYAANTPGRFRQAARLVDRILKGARPEDLPTEQPTAFELVINLKTTKALGLDLPSTLLARADEVIE
jgi:putative ABC transport system substrate-binding protein